MIEPIQSGQTLLADIARTQPEPGAVAIWWLGQSGYAIKTTSSLFFVDLYLSEHLTAKYADTEKPHIRMTRAPLRGGDLTGVRWVFASHKHSDHLDPGTLPDLFRASPEARLVLPMRLIDHAAALGLDRARLVPTRGNETLTCEGITVHVIPSAHPEMDYTEAEGYAFLGFIFEVDGVRLYHSGDTLAYDGLAATLRRYQPDIAFLPINGTDERLHRLQVPPNMNAREAVELARSAGIPLIIPHHYDMFTFNTVGVREFTTLADTAGQPYHVLGCGERFLWRRE
jgi:L-ascorbate 6-phosphate lactonase